MLKHRIYQIIIALDQLANALAFGWADETFSARCWRQRHKNRFWGFMRCLVDSVFFFEKNHCKQAFCNELLDVHKGSEYQEARKQ